MNQECCDINGIIKEFYDYLKSYILSKTKDNAIAEDIVQNVMVKLIESYHKGTEIKNTKAWLFQVSRNCIADYYKNRSLELPSHLLEHADIVTNQDIPKITTSDYIIPMIRLLPEPFSKPLELSDIKNIPQKEIASLLNISLSATKMRIQRGRLKLSALFAECCDLEYDKNNTLIGCTIKSNCDSLQNIRKKLEDKAL